MKKILKWVLISLGGILLAIILIVGGFFAWLNYQGPKTEEQKESLQQIKNLNAPVKPAGFSEDYSDLPDVVPEIYDDRHLDDVQATSEVETDE